ncbi:MAG: sulfite exporter TauE/SafE family protein, partial [Acidobacteriota bacterium]
MLAYIFSFVAGLLTSLSPCVLPALPIVVGSAAQRHRLAPIAVAGGMISAFTVLGVALASTGTLLGVTGSTLRLTAAVLLVASGAVLLSARLQTLISRLLSPLSQRASRLAGSQRLSGPGGQFLLGGLLGVVWSPCTAPTLGAAVGLVAQAGGGLEAASLMSVFGIGAALPLLAVAYVARFFMSRRAGLQWIGSAGKTA